MLPNETPEICRLCLVKEHVNINIFEDDTQQLFYKINSCLPINIAVEDVLPKKICSSCCEKVNLLYEFWNQTLHAQKYLLTWLNDENKFGSYRDDANQKSTNETEKSETNYRDFKCDTNGQKNEDFSNNSSPDFWCSNKDESDDCDNSSLHDDVGFNDSEFSAQSVMSDKSKASALERLQGSDQPTEPQSAPDTSTKSSTAKRAARRRSSGAKKSGAGAKAQSAPAQSAPDADAQEAAKPVLCARCPQTFATLALLAKHERAAHAADTLFSCDRCSFTTRTKGCLTTHVRRRHVHNYACDECPQGFFTRKELTAHHVQAHDAQPFQCAVCDELFVAKSQLYAHIRGHDASSSYVCEVCGRTYKKKNSYKRHITRSHLGVSTEAQCDVCQRVLSSKDHLRRHMLTHTDERNWVCSTCGKCFLSKTYLTEHSRIHLGIRPYKCEICGKCFTQRGSLTIHKRSHTGERPYRCEFCHKGFVMSTLLRYHLRKCSLATSTEEGGAQPVATESNPFLCSGPLITEVVAKADARSAFAATRMSQDQIGVVSSSALRTAADAT